MPLVRPIRIGARTIGIHRHDALVRAWSADIRVLDAADRAAVQIAVELNGAEVAEVICTASGGYICVCDLKGPGEGEDSEGQPQEEDGLSDGRHGLQG